MKIIVKVPTESVANVIGPSGSVIRQLQGISETKIKLKCEDHLEYAVCYINGQKENAELAEKLIIDIIANKSPLMKGKKDSDSAEKENDSRYERFSDTINDTMIQVYVSSIYNPSIFWLQLITPKACALEHLVDDMTEFYSLEENRKQYQLSKVTVGQIVATKLQTDEKWCRAEVYGIRGKAKEQTSETLIDLFCVDYGDSSYHTLKNVYQIKTEFLSLRFQAIEATMSDIIPKNGSDWSEESRKAFESMVFTGEWKVMLAQVVDYKKRGKSTRKPNPIPCVRLFDPEGPQGVDIGQKLIKMGLASPAVKSDLANGSVSEDKKEVKKKRSNGIKHSKKDEIKKKEETLKKNGVATSMKDVASLAKGVSTTMKVVLPNSKEINKKDNGVREVNRKVEGTSNKQK